MHTTPIRHVPRGCPARVPPHTVAARGERSHGQPTPTTAPAVIPQREVVPRLAPVRIGSPIGGRDVASKCSGCHPNGGGGGGNSRGGSGRPQRPPLAATPGKKGVAAIATAATAAAMATMETATAAAVAAGALAAALGGAPVAPHPTCCLTPAQAAASVSGGPSQHADGGIDGASGERERRA